MEVEVVHQYTELGQPLPWVDVYVPHGWQLNQLVPAILTSSPSRHCEILWCQAFLMLDL
jgi:hypothetical protein